MRSLKEKLGSGYDVVLYLYSFDVDDIGFKSVVLYGFH